MYTIIEREKIGKKRFGRYIVEFTCKWPSDSSFMYLVSTFTSLFPGRIEMYKTENKAKARVWLYEDEYPYLFMNDKFESFIDEDNIQKTTLKLDDISLECSLADIGIKELKDAINGGGFHPELILHNENESYFVHYYLNNTVIRLTTIKDEVEKIFVEYNIKNKKEIIEMEKIFHDKFRDYFEAIINKKIDKYRFILNYNKKTRFFGQDGIDDKKFIHAHIKGLIKAEWWLGSIYYLIFPDRFDISYKKINIIKDDRMEEKTNTYYGGNIDGIIKRLDYIKELGIEAIYLTPINKAMSYHRYDVIDYFEIDELLGDMNDFNELLTEAHKRNIKVILDLVAHHSSPLTFMFLDLIENPDSIYKGWYRLTKNFQELPISISKSFLNFLKNGMLSEELKKVKPFYEGFMASWKMPKFNHSNPEVLEFFKKVIEYWMEKGIDGFRVDVAHALPDKFLNEIYSTIKSFGNDKVMIMEISYGLEYYPLGKIADSAMNYDLRRYILDFFIHKRINSQELSSRIMEQYFNLPLYVANALYNLLGSHDTPRIATVAKKSENLLKTIYAFLFALYGSPSIYYGDEIAMEGGNDPDCRKPMIWERNLWNHNLLEFIKKLIYLRKKIEVMRLGRFKCKPIDEDSLIIEREYINQKFIAIFNRNDNREINIRLDKEYIDLFTDRLVKDLNIKSFIYLYKSIQ